MKKISSILLLCLFGFLVLSLFFSFLNEEKKQSEKSIVKKSIRKTKQSTGSENSMKTRTKTSITTSKKGNKKSEFKDNEEERKMREKELNTEEENVVIIGNKKIQVEVAKTQAEKAKGLSDRESLPENHGMIFVNQQAKKPNFWMKDMNFPIDIIWINEDREVIGSEKRVTTDSFPDTFKPSKPAKYILEVNAGFVDENNISKGSAVDLSGVSY